MVAPEARWQALLPVLRHWPLAVAFSGGLDSRFLCFALRRAGCDVLALHATGPHVPQAESAAARRWARTQGLPLLEVRHRSPFPARSGGEQPGALLCLQAGPHAPSA